MLPNGRRADEGWKNQRLTIFPPHLEGLNVVWLREDQTLVTTKGMACAMIEYNDLHDLICVSAMGFA